MSKTPFSDKVDFLGDFWSEWKDEEANHESWKEFFKIYDVGLPLAWLISYKYASFNKMGNGKEIIEETWQALCEALGISPDDKYPTLVSMLKASPLGFEFDDVEDEEDDDES
jgi:hypothetical protein